MKELPPLEYNSTLFADLAKEIDDKITTIESSDESSVFFDVGSYVNRFIRTDEFFKTATDAEKVFGRKGCESLLLQWVRYYVKTHSTHDEQYRTEIIDHEDVDDDGQYCREHVVVISTYDNHDGLTGLPDFVKSGGLRR